MKQDELIEAIATVRQGLMTVGGMFTADDAYTALLKLSVMRDFVHNNDASGFTAYVQGSLSAKSLDITCELLTQLWTALGLNSMTTTWEQFADGFLE